MIACPIAELGCISEIPADNLLEHYSSRIHQETLLKAIEIYVRELHLKTRHRYPSIHSDDDDYPQMLDSLNILAEGLSCLQNDNVELHIDSVRLFSNITEMQKQIEQLKKSEEESSQMLRVVQMNDNILQTSIEALQQTLLDSSSLAANNGSYIWKITGVAEKIANAIADRQTSIYSPPFYSSPTGYKMCMRLYLNGDGQARRTHLSLFFVLMRGNYDPILVWPFQYKITFCLYDQTGSQRHMIDSFRPDTRSNSFQQPRSNMNIASGIPKFLPLSIIQQENNPYIRDDCMFIRCIADFASMPKVCIPYMANINPGLPLAIQQTAIQAEIEKHKSAASKESNTADTSKNTNDLKVNK